MVLGIRGCWNSCVERWSGGVVGSQVIFKVVRPFYWISSTIYVEDGEGNRVGEVRQRWHLWKRQGTPTWNPVWSSI